MALWFDKRYGEWVEEPGKHSQTSAIFCTPKVDKIWVLIGKKHNRIYLYTYVYISLYSECISVLPLIASYLYLLMCMYKHVHEYATYPLFLELSRFLWLFCHSPMTELDVWDN